MGSLATKESCSGLTLAERDFLRTKTKFTSQEIHEWYRKFHTEYPNGYITKDQFIELYHDILTEGDASIYATYLFNAYDTDGNGTISFAEFLTTLNISLYGEIEDKLRWTFRMYDLDGGGTLTRQEAINVIIAIQRSKGGACNRENADEIAMKIFVLADKDHDYTISENEFVAAVKRAPAVISQLQDCKMP